MTASSIPKSSDTRQMQHASGLGPISAEIGIIEMQMNAQQKLQMTSPPRNRSLDFLRGFAILLVLFNHLEPLTVPMLPNLEGVSGFIYWRLKNLGWTGVDLFFVLSGFLISGLLFKELEQTGRLNLGRFWVRRGFKILPSYWLLLGVLAITGAGHWLVTHSGLDLIRSLLAHLLFFQNYLAFNPNGPTWSLAVEEHFYLLLPLLLLLVIRKTGQGMTVKTTRTLGWTLLAILFGIPILRLLGAVHGLHLEDFRRTHFRLDGLSYGVLAQLLCRYHAEALTPLRRHPAVAYLIGLAFVSSGFFLNPMQPVMFTFGYTLLSIGYSLFLLTSYLNGLGRWEQFKVVRVVTQVGRWSYNIFLWNFFLWVLPLPFYRQAHNWVAAQGHWPPLQVIEHFLIFSAFAIILGALLTELFENPILKLRERIPWNSRRSATTKLGNNLVPEPGQA